MAKGSRATATDYNNIQTIAATILGPGTSGYGQEILSSPVTAGSTIYASQWANLRRDLAYCREHQTGSVTGTGLASVAGNIGTPWQQLQTITGSTTISEDIRSQYSQFATGGVQPSANTAHSSQLTSAALGGTTSQTRTGSTAPWGSSGNVGIYHTFTVTFGGYTSGSTAISTVNHANAFFNAGGYIRISCAGSGGLSATTGSKDKDWKTTVEKHGFLDFKKTTSTVTGTGSPAAIGWSGLTGSYQTILTTQGTAGVYAENYYRIQAYKSATNAITFKIIFQDADLGDDTTPSDGYDNKVDEAVTLTLVSSITSYRPTGVVQVPVPTSAVGAWTAT